MVTCRPAVFLDRDGTLNELVPGEDGLDSPFHPDQLVLVRRAGPFVRALNELGYLCLVVTNQPGLAKGKVTIERLHHLHEQLRRELARSGAHLDGIYYCPHHPDPGPGGRADLAGPCGCRKPAPGLLLRAADEHHVDVRRSFLVGDRAIDAAAGRAAGVRTILLSAAGGELARQLEEVPEGRPDHVVRGLDGALTLIRQRRAAMVGDRG